MKKIKETYVFSEGDSMSRPSGMVILTMGDGIHGRPLLGGLLVTESSRRTGVATRVVAKAEDYATMRTQPAIFAVTHFDNLEARAFFHAAGYTEMILLEKKLTKPEGEAREDYSRDRINLE